jgi:hypothetical protein
MRHPFALATALLLALPAAQAGTEKRPSPSGTTTAWVSTGEAFALELIQLTPDVVRAMYGNRKFPKFLLDEIAGYCVFGSVARNDSKTPLSYDVHDWRYTPRGGKPQKLRTKVEWLAHWKKHGVDFSYSILPAALTFEAGDWGQGLTTVKLPPGAVFDLTYTWTQNGKRHSAKLEGVECAHNPE